MNTIIIIKEHNKSCKKTLKDYITQEAQLVSFPV